jgi:hypothetical protein
LIALMSSRSLLLSSSCLVLLAGCALHTPYKVLRYNVDYNTERHLSAQVESYDHLPLKPVRVKLMRFGYNVGPLPSGTGTLGIGTGRYTSCDKHDDCEPVMMMDGSVMPPPVIAPPMPADQPLLPPPAPPAEVGARWNDLSVRQAGYRRGNVNQASQAAWIFGAPSAR